VNADVSTAFCGEYRHASPLLKPNRDSGMAHARS
jgi:hypothetical protein